ncbi:MAG: polynucleotide adenylyltransferase, partial [Clostridia bacterium]
MKIPENVNNLITRLEAAGFEAYAVGGCVRDSVMGRKPKDWDICTSALPHQIEAVFSDCRIIETGIKHGTVTVMTDGEGYEITTFRVDGEYLDSRRPERVEFTENVVLDLARRD